MCTHMYVYLHYACMCVYVCMHTLYFIILIFYRSRGASPAVQVDDVTTVKILVLGDKGVGKTSFILKYTKSDYDIHKNPVVSI